MKRFREYGGVAALARGLALFALLMLPALPGSAAVEVIGVFQDWTAYQTGSGATKVCYIASKPTKDEGKYSKRGEIYALVTHRPGAKSFNVVSVHIGYRYKEGSTAEVVVGGNKFALFTHNETAWATDSADDKALVRIMRAGSKMIIRGRSWRGTATKDTYSLTGFTAAHRAINKACKAP